MIKFCLTQLAKALLHLLGWRINLGAWPPNKCILIFYPHTSNWDFVIGMIARVASGVPCHWFGKHTMFRWPFHKLLLGLGGIPVDREHPSGVIGQLAAEFAKRDSLILGLAPEGTRRKAAYWRSGFYHLALAARVPVGLGFIDFSRKEIGVGPYHWMSGDIASDLARIREFYADRRGKYPALESVIELAEVKALPRDESRGR